MGGGYRRLTSFTQADPFTLQPGRPETNSALTCSRLALLPRAGPTRSATTSSRSLPTSSSPMAQTVSSTMTVDSPTLVSPWHPSTLCEFQRAVERGVRELTRLSHSRTDHFYPALNWLLQKDKSWMQYYTKNFYVGELDWTYSVRLAPLLSFFLLSSPRFSLCRRAATLLRAFTLSSSRCLTRAR